MKALFYCTRAICSLWSITRHVTTNCSALVSAVQQIVVSAVQQCSRTTRRLVALRVQRIRTARQGFSLVELMIVVAIIGVLTAIAIPNFQAFQARSRQSEAKAALTSIYTAEQAFHSQWEVYAAPFAAIGYKPGGDYRYAAGFDSDLTGGKKLGGNGKDLTGTAADTIGTGPAPGRAYTGPKNTAVTDKEWNTEKYCATHSECKFTGVAGQDDAIDAGANDSTALSVNAFLAAAIGDPKGEGASCVAATVTGCDSWQINQDKQLLHKKNQLE